MSRLPSPEPSRGPPRSLTTTRAPRAASCIASRASEATARAGDDRHPIVETKLVRHGGTIRDVRQSAPGSAGFTARDGRGRPMIALSCGFPPSIDLPTYARLAESLGYERVWAYDSPALYGDVWVALARVAEATDRIGVATGVAVPSLRHPVVTASAIATIEELAPGRLAGRVRHRVHRPPGDGEAGHALVRPRPLRHAGARAAAGRGGGGRRRRVPVALFAGVRAPAPDQRAAPRRAGGPEGFRGRPRRGRRRRARRVCHRKANATTGRRARC